MEKLNELVYRAERYLLTKSESQPEQINVSCKTILAIAEAFRELERRAEAAEAKLAESENQDDNSVAWIETSKNGFEKGQKIINYYSENIQNLAEGSNLFTRPAPAADPADLVPEEMMPKQASRSYGGEVVGYSDGFNSCRAAILRNIEEAK